MNEKYFELTISSNQIQIFKNFAFDLGVECIEECENSFIIRDESDLEILKFAFLEFYKRLSENLKNQMQEQISLNLDLQIKDNKNWIDEYKKGVAPVQVGEIYVRPSWEEPKNGLKNIIIDPGLAFGSGHHESTNMCLNLIQKYLNAGQSLLDVGCGSGILSLSAVALGAKVSACDTDELAIKSTRENAEKNGLALEKTWVGSANGDASGKIVNIGNDGVNLTSCNSEKSAEIDANSGANLQTQRELNLNANSAHIPCANFAKFDIVVANIIADVIIIIQNDLKNRLKTGGILILSGILEKYLDTIKTNFKDLTLLEIKRENEWCSFVFKKEGE